jgi:chorismate synthase
VGNTWGQLLCVTTWGESHGAGIGAMVDGCPARLPLSEADIQPDLDRRVPGQSAITTQRKETGSVQILSGVFEGVTRGTPISMLIPNADMRPGDYREVMDQRSGPHGPSQASCRLEQPVTCANGDAVRVVLGTLSATPSSAHAARRLTYRAAAAEGRFA